MGSKAHSIAFGKQRAFTLIEVVVALAILALSAGVLYESFGWSLRRTGVLQRQESAWLAAQSLLAEIRGREALQTGVTNGQTAEGLRWNSHIETYPVPAAQGNPIQAFAVSIEVRWGTRPAQRVRLQSVETGKVAT